jgi:uncharacterized protein (DUF2267 family)
MLFGSAVLSTKILPLDRAINNTIQWIDDIQTELGWESRQDTYKATKAVLQATRDRLPVEEVVHLCANLPLVMKGMLMDGYDLKEKPAKIRSIEEFDETVQQYYDGTMRELIFAEDAASAVLKVLNRRIGGGEMRKVAATMPEGLRRLFEPAIVEELRRKMEAPPQ